MKKWEIEALKAGKGSKTFAAKILGAKGGSVKSEAKAEAARRNGKKGGRPRKKKGKKK